jgi:hypothetical protein
VSVASDGTEANGASGPPAISLNGRVIAFVSGASNLVADDTNDAVDVFVHDTATGETTRVSVASGGGQANGGSGAVAVSGNGRFVIFTSDASNLVTDASTLVLGDSNRLADVFLHDTRD